MPSMFLGYADESGEPGLKKSGHDFFVFCIVLLKSEKELDKIQKKIMRFRAKNDLPEDHEFHFATDSNKIRPAFTKFIGNLDFDFISISIKKNNLRNTASFRNMASLVLKLLNNKQIEAKIVMDVNPALYRELRSQKKNYVNKLHFTERKSHASDMIQIADYVTALRTRALKYPSKKEVADMYGVISSKMIGEIEK